MGKPEVVVCGLLCTTVVIMVGHVPVDRGGDDLNCLCVSFLLLWVYIMCIVVLNAPQNSFFVNYILNELERKGLVLEPCWCCIEGGSSNHFCHLQYLRQNFPCVCV